MELHTIGIDLGKTVFHPVGLNLHGEVVVRKKFSRAQLLRFTATVQVKLIGMKDGGGAHFLGRAQRELDLQSLYRVRERWVMRRTAVIRLCRRLRHKETDADYRHQGHGTDPSFPRGRPYRGISFRRRCSLSLIISFKS